MVGAQEREGARIMDIVDRMMMWIFFPIAGLMSLFLIVLIGTGIRLRPSLWMPLTGSVRLTFPYERWLWSGRS